MNNNCLTNDIFEELDNKSLEELTKSLINIDFTNIVYSYYESHKIDYLIKKKLYIPEYITEIYFNKNDQFEPFGKIGIFDFIKNQINYYNYSNETNFNNKWQAKKGNALVGFELFSNDNYIYKFRIIEAPIHLIHSYNPITKESINLIFNDWFICENDFNHNKYFMNTNNYKLIYMNNMYISGFQLKYSSCLISFGKVYFKIGPYKINNKINLNNINTYKKNSIEYICCILINNINKFITPSSTTSNLNNQFITPSTNLNNKFITPSSTTSSNLNNQFITPSSTNSYNLNNQLITLSTNLNNQFITPSSTNSYNLNNQFITPSTNLNNQFITQSSTNSSNLNNQFITPSTNLNNQFITPSSTNSSNLNNQFITPSTNLNNQFITPSSSNLINNQLITSTNYDNINNNELITSSPSYSLNNQPTQKSENKTAIKVAEVAYESAIKVEAVKKVASESAKVASKKVVEATFAESSAKKAEAVKNAASESAKVASKKVAEVATTSAKKAEAVKNAVAEAAKVASKKVADVASKKVAEVAAATAKKAEAVKNAASESAKVASKKVAEVASTSAKKAEAVKNAAASAAKVASKKVADVAPKKVAEVAAASAKKAEAVKNIASESAKVASKKVAEVAATSAKKAEAVKNAASEAAKVASKKVADVAPKKVAEVAAATAKKAEAVKNVASGAFKNVASAVKKVAEAAKNSKKKNDNIINKNTEDTVNKDSKKKNSNELFNIGNIINNIEWNDNKKIKNNVEEIIYNNTIIEKAQLFILNKEGIYFNIKNLSNNSYTLIVYIKLGTADSFYLYIGNDRYIYNNDILNFRNYTKITINFNKFTYNKNDDFLIKLSTIGNIDNNYTIYAYGWQIFENNQKYELFDKTLSDISNNINTIELMTTDSDSINLSNKNNNKIKEKENNIYYKYNIIIFLFIFIIIIYSLKK